MSLPPQPNKTGKRYPTGNAMTAGGGGISFNPRETINLGLGLTRDILKGDAHKGLQSKNPDLFNAIKNSRGQGLSSSLFKDNLGLYGKGNKKIATDVVPTSEPESLDAYNTLRDSEIERLKAQQGINNQILGMFPALLSANSGVVNRFNSIVDQGLTELDPAISNRIDRGVQGYIGNATNNFKDAYSRIADGFVNDVAEGGIGGFGVGEGFKQQVTEPLSRDISNIVNQAEVYRGQLTNDVLNNQRAGLSTLASSTPALNQILQGLQLPVNQVNPAAINPTGNFDPALFAQMLQFTNTFQAGRDDAAMQPWLLQLQAELQKQIAASQQPNPAGSILGGIGASLPLLAMGPAGIAAAGVGAAAKGIQTLTK